MKLLVGVLTHRSAKTLPDLLLSLPDGLAGVDEWQLVIADSGSDDETIKVARQLAPTATVVELGSNLGFAAAANAAAAAEPGTEAVLVLSPTVRLRPGCVRRMLDGLDEPGVGVAVPRLYNAAGQHKFSLRRRPTVLRAFSEAVLGGTAARRFPSMSEIVADPAVYAKPTTADWATGAVTLVSRDCLKSVGPWDETYFLYSEETDFELRAADCGFRVAYVPDAEAVHIGGEAHVVPRLWGINRANRVRLYAKRHGRSASLAYWSATALGEALRAAAGRGATHRHALRKLIRERRTLLRGLPADTT